MRRRCSLCGGKLNGNICTECGLDNSKNDDQYVTLENSGHEESLTHVHTEEEKPYEGKTMTRENVRKAKNADKNAKKAAAKRRQRMRQQVKQIRWVTDILQQMRATIPQAQATARQETRVTVIHHLQCNKAADR